MEGETIWDFFGSRLHFALATSNSSICFISLALSFMETNKGMFLKRSIVILGSTPYFYKYIF